MHINWELGWKGNLLEAINKINWANAKIDNTQSDLTQTNNTITENQTETDELMLDHEERLILLEVGE